MNLSAPVSSLMTSPVHTANPKDKLLVVKELFDNYQIHHIPIVEKDLVVGIVSKTDLLSFLKGMTNNNYQAHMNKIRLKNYHVEDIMTVKIAVVRPKDTIKDALGIFKLNTFHALPVVENERLLGILTTQDIIQELYLEKEKA